MIISGVMNSHVIMMRFIVGLLEFQVVNLPFVVVRTDECYIRSKWTVPVRQGNECMKPTCTGDIMSYRLG